MRRFSRPKLRPLATVALLTLLAACGGGGGFVASPGGPPGGLTISSVAVQSDSGGSAAFELPEGAGVLQFRDGETGAPVSNATFQLWSDGTHALLSGSAAGYLPICKAIPVESLLGPSSAATAFVLVPPMLLDSMASSGVPATGVYEQGVCSPTVVNARLSGHYEFVRTVDAQRARELITEEVLRVFVEDTFEYLRDRLRGIGITEGAAALEIHLPEAYHVVDGFSTAVDLVTGPAKHLGILAMDRFMVALGSDDYEYDIFRWTGVGDDAIPFVVVPHGAIPPLAPQHGSGSVTGAIQSGGASLQGVALTLTGRTLMQSRQAESDASGAYSLSDLPDGTYRMQVRKEGYLSFHDEQVTVSDGATTVLNLNLVDLRDAELATDTPSVVIHPGASDSSRIGVWNRGALQPLDWRIQGVPTWLSLSATQGTLEPKVYQSLTATVTPGASGVANLTLTSDTTGQSISISVSISGTSSSADLEVANGSVASSSVAPGASVGVTWSIYNSGGSTANPSVTVVRINQSSFSASGSNLASPSVPSLAGGALHQQSASLTAPTQAGTYSVWVIADNTSTAGQSASAAGDDIVRVGTFTVSGSASTTYSISPASKTVSESAGTVTFTVSRTGATPAETLYVSTSQSEGHSNSGDYSTTWNSTAFSFTSGQSTKDVTVTLTNDSKSEGTEKFGLIVQRNAGDPVSTYLAKATFTITDDDSSSGSTTYSISPTSKTVSESAGSVKFTVTRSGSTPAETVYVSTTQTEGHSNSSDYATNWNSTAFSFTSGQTTKDISVSITDDSKSESTEKFGLVVQRQANDPVSTYLVKATFTITDDDSSSSSTTYSISPTSKSVSENAGSVKFTVTRSGATPAETLYVSTVQTEGYSNSNDYATNWNNTAFSFTSGQTSKEITVTITNDSTSENNEKFGLIVQRSTSDPVSTYLVKATFTITNDD